ncbi:hypothetical protein [Baekduia sp. Peel2402]|uniref:hypothetical protein n=1 Tax=Baekduia sp. Peel2402 TaxID=3458296 RepID=UPI00403E924C
MADSHISLLEAIARHRQRRVDQLDAETGHSAGRRTDLALAAARARAQATAAAARRRLPTGR